MLPFRPIGGFTTGFTPAAISQPPQKIDSPLSGAIDYEKQIIEQVETLYNYRSWMGEPNLPSNLINTIGRIKALAMAICRTMPENIQQSKDAILSRKAIDAQLLNLETECTFFLKEHEKIASSYTTIERAAFQDSLLKIRLIVSKLLLPLYRQHVSQLNCSGDPLFNHDIAICKDPAFCTIVQQALENISQISEVKQWKRNVMIYSLNTFLELERTWLSNLQLHLSKINIKVSSLQRWERDTVYDKIILIGTDALKNIRIGSLNSTDEAWLDHVRSMGKTKNLYPIALCDDQIFWPMINDFDPLLSEVNVFAEGSFPVSKRNYHHVLFDFISTLYRLEASKIAHQKIVDELKAQLEPVLKNASTFPTNAEEQKRANDICTENYRLLY